MAYLSALLWTYVKVLSANNTIHNGLADAITNEIFLIVPWLGCCINRSEAGGDGSVDQLGCLIFLPGCAIEEDWDRCGGGVEARA
jgi:hypothetical protein